MPLARIIINNFKSIKKCDITLSELNLLIGENGTGKTNLLEAINYFYNNLTDNNANDQVFDENNRYSNEVRIALVFDMSGFVKISKSNSEELPDIFEDQPIEKTKYRGYYKAIIAMASPTKDKMLRVELSQIKGQSIKWNYSYEERLIFKSLFPIFYIDTRNLDVTEWGYVWDVLGELSKVSNSERKSIEGKINGILASESKEMSSKIKGITEIFNAANVSVTPSMSKDFAKTLSKLYFSGEVIQQDGKRLRYFSTGTNSVKYIELILRSINEIAKTKLKEPIVLVDEPELSLHTKYLDELTDSILDTNTKLCIVLSTHSPRLTKNTISEYENTTLYNVKLINHYSHIRRMNRFPQYSPTSKYRVTDEHINSYFSRAILFVEGESELELFSNPYLRLLFPQLRDVDVFKASSDAPILNIMNPKLNKMRTPYLCLIDMDKALNYNNKKFNLKGEYFKDSRKEQLQFRNKHQSEPFLYHQRRHIEAMAAGLHVHYYMPFLSCNDPNYRAFIDAIHQYLLSYNVFTFDTTVEGALVNKYTIDHALDYLQKRKKPADYTAFKSLWDGMRKTDQLNALRIVFNGKSDLLKTRKTLFKELEQSQPGLKEILKKVVVGEKTSGWISEYIDDFFQIQTQSRNPMPPKVFRQYISNEENCISITKEFKYHFPELYSLIDTMSTMVYK